jgi:hypothetical protein
VVEREGLCAALYAQNGTGVARVGLLLLEGVMRQGKFTYHVDLVLGENADGCGAARDFLLVPGVCVMSQPCFWVQ